MCYTSVINLDRKDEAVYTKYPSTPHLPFSASRGEGDFESDTFAFMGRECVVTEKMDGENTTLYADYLHARSLDSAHHASRSWVKAHHAEHGWKIGQGVRVIAENMYAQHSLRYESLTSFLYGIAVVSEGAFWGWDESVLMFEELCIPAAPVLYRGIATEKVLRSIAENMDPSTQEGFVVRTAGSFPEGDFASHCAKYVRPGHVQTTGDWKATWVPNALRG